MEAKAIQKFFPQLISAVGTCVQNVSDCCFSESLIEETTHRQVLKLARTDADKARILMVAVRESVTRNHKCFDVFMSVLKKVLPGLDDPLLKAIKAAVDSNVNEVEESQIPSPPQSQTLHGSSDSTATSRSETQQGEFIQKGHTHALKGAEEPDSMTSAISEDMISDNHQFSSSVTSADIHEDTLVLNQSQTLKVQAEDAAQGASFCKMMQTDTKYHNSNDSNESSVIEVQGDCQMKSNEDFEEEEHLDGQLGHHDDTSFGSMPTLRDVDFQKEELSDEENDELATEKKTLKRLPAAKSDRTVSLHPSKASLKLGSSHHPKNSDLISVKDTDSKKTAGVELTGDKKPLLPRTRDDSSDEEESPSSRSIAKDSGKSHHYPGIGSPVFCPPDPNGCSYQQHPAHHMLPRPLPLQQGIPLDPYHPALPCRPPPAADVLQPPPHGIMPGAPSHLPMMYLPYARVPHGHVLPPRAGLPPKKRSAAQHRNEGDLKNSDSAKEVQRVKEIQARTRTYSEMSYPKFETRSKKRGLLRTSETIASRLLLGKKCKTIDIVDEYMKILRGKEEDYFLREPAYPKTLTEDSDSDERDSDYENELASVKFNDVESGGDDSDCSCSESQLQTEILTTTTQSAYPLPTKNQDSNATKYKWEVECTPRVLRKLKHKKTPEKLRKAICATIFDDLAKGRHWHRVETCNKKHQLFKKRVPGKKQVTILWERVMQFSFEASTSGPVYTDVIRLWDVVMNEKSYKEVIDAIESSWERERTITGSEEHVLSDLDESRNQVPEHIISKKVTDIKTFLSADPDPTQYKPLIVHIVPRKINEIISSCSRKFDLPLKLWAEEYGIVTMKPEKPIVVLGRSGTGKTTCCLYRMVQEFLNYQNIAKSSSDLPPLRQVFVTKNKHLRKKFEEQFRRLVIRFSLSYAYKGDSDGRKPHHLTDLHPPVFITNDEFLYLLDHSINGKEAIHACDPYLGCHATSDSQNAIKEVDASYFVSVIWKEIGKRNPYKKKFDPLLVWMEIVTFIKGYSDSQLSEKEYCQLSSRIAPNFANSRKEVYQFFNDYDQHCRSSSIKFKKLYDKCDLVLNLYHKIIKLKEEGPTDLPWLFDSLYVDEVQDFTQIEILLLLQCHKDPKQNVFLTGDTAQTVMKDVSFRFKDLRALFHETKFLPDVAPKLNILQINYRSHAGILNLAKFVLNLIETYHPDSIDTAPNDEAVFVGPKPKFIKSCDNDTLMHILASNVRNPSDIRFGHHQAIIVRNDEREQDIPIKNALVFSVYESKGLEFDDVLLYNFFSDSEEKDIWKKDCENLPSIELKHLYTAITRAKCNLWIYEIAPDQEIELPIVREWIKSGEGLVELTEPASLNAEISLATARRSTPDQWKMQGDVLRQEMKWRQACFCYDRADRPDLGTQTEIERLEAQPQPNHLEIALAYLIADEVSHNVKYIEEAAENLVRAGNYAHAARLYTALSKKHLAVDTYIHGKCYKEASKLYEKDKMYCKSIEVLCDNKCYREAAAKAKKFEELGISLSDDLSSNQIARKYIKRYWNHQQTSTEETAIFYKLLEYITDQKMKILCCKHARRFAYPLEVYFESYQYSAFYRLALAHGPDNIPSMDDSLNTSLTHYDVALHLSMICKHFTMHEALVINSARSHVYSINPSKTATELECLIRDSTNVGNQLNAHLLLARHDRNRIPQALKVCCEYDCLPMEIELALMILQQSDKQKLPLSHIQLAHKILFLLSSHERTLLSAYEEMLGIHRGKTDECYLEQWRYSEYLEDKLVSDCYLLPQESQSIWVQVLTRNTYRDIDRMYIISLSHLVSSIKEHLKNALRKIKTSFTDIQSSLSKETGKGFNPEDISYSLQCCQLMLLVHDSAATLLRQYHSIEWSHYFPLCTNFVQWIDFIKIGFLHLQSSTKKWLKEFFEKRSQFDVLKLWEQASVVKLAPTLEEFLVSSESQSSIHDEAYKCYKMGIIWIDICNQVVDDPLKSCSMFFTDYLCEFMPLDFNVRSIVDSISIFGTIVLALLSCVSDSSTPIIIPHMYYRALQVYDSLLPKAKSQKKNILDSCFAQIDDMVKSDPAGHQELLHYLLSAINQIELLFQSKFYSQSVHQISDLPRLTIILMLTLYMNYAVINEHPDSFDSHHSKFVFHLTEQLKFQRYLDFNSSKVCNAFQKAKNPLSLVRILKYLLCPNSRTERYESLAIIVCSKKHKNIIIESVDDEDARILVSPEIQAQELPDQQHLPISPLLPKDKRQKHLYFSLPCRHGYSGPLRTESPAPVWMLYKECSEDVHEHVREFVHQVISKNLAFASTIRNKTLFQQYLHCLSHTTRKH